MVFLRFYNNFSYIAVKFLEENIAYQEFQQEKEKILKLSEEQSFQQTEESKDSNECKYDYQLKLF